MGIKNLILKSIALLIFLFVGQVVLAQTKTYQVKVLEAVLYDQPLDDAKALLKLKFGEKVTVGKFIRNDSWASVIYKGSTGYIRANQLKPAETGGKQKVEMQPYHVIAYEAKLHNSPSASSSALSTLKLGTNINYISDDEGWAKVKVGSQIGYIQYRSIRAGRYTQKQAKADKAKKEEAAISEVWVVKVATADLKAKADVNAGVISRLSKGTELEVVGRVNGNKWAKVRYNNAIGYISFRFLKRYNSDPPPPKQAQRIGAVCRDGKVVSRTGRNACEKHNGVLRWIYKQQ